MGTDKAIDEAEDRAPDEGTDPRPDEGDVDSDDKQALSRSTGGVEDPSQPDQGSTTGTTPNGVFVGRVAGQDVGYEGEQGAERRAAGERGV